MTWGISDKQLDEIIDFLSKDENFVSGIIASTGSGKSTKLVQKIFEQKSKIFVSEPTVVAAENLYRYMIPKIGVSNVGFAAEGNIHYTESSRVVYCTSGHLRRKFLSYFEDGKVKNGKIDFCDVLMLDEVHNGSLDYDIIMELWNLAFKQGAEIPRLVLSSATLQKDTTIFDKLPVYEVKLEGYPIQEYYAEQDYDINSRAILTETASEVISYHQKFPVDQMKTSKWLVFCPGSSEVEKVCQILETAKMENVNILPAYSSLQRNEMEKIFETPELGTRTIIVATNIAEASLTIDGLDGIFDTLLEKVIETAQSGGSRLVHQNISKSSAEQRKGRTGRTNPGFIFRLCTQEGFKRFKPQREREIFRVPITNVIIEMLDIGVDPVQLFTGRVLEKKVRFTFGQLKELGMIDKNKMVTQKGHFAPDLPLSVYNSAVIWEWSQLSKPDGSKYPLFPILALASLIDCYGPSYFFYPKKEYHQSEKEYREISEAHFNKYFKLFQGKNDLEVLLTLWNATCSHFETVSPNKNDLQRWCATYSLNNKKMMEVFGVVKQCCMVLMKKNYEVGLGTFSEKNVLQVALPLLEESYKKDIFEYQDQSKSYYNPETREYYKLNIKNSLTPQLPRHLQNPPRIIALSKAELPNSTGGVPIRLISLSVPL